MTRFIKFELEYLIRICVRHQNLWKPLKETEMSRYLTEVFSQMLLRCAWLLVYGSSCVVCNFGVPYSGGWSFPHYFCTILFPSHVPVLWQIQREDICNNFLPGVAMYKHIWKITILTYIFRYLGNGNDTRYGHSYNGRQLGNWMHPIKWWHFQCTRVTVDTDYKGMQLC